MSAYDRILLPTDGSETGVESSLNHALVQAQQFDAVLHVIYVSDNVVGETAAYMGNKSPGDKAALDRIKQQAERYGVETKTDIVEDDPVDGIIDYAETRAMDLIVMGTHGRTGISRVLEGSVTEKVVRKSDKPVLAVQRED